MNFQQIIIIFCISVSVLTGCETTKKTRSSNISQSQTPTTDVNQTNSKPEVSLTESDRKFLNSITYPITKLNWNDLSDNQKIRAGHYACNWSSDQDLFGFVQRFTSALGSNPDTFAVAEGGLIIKKGIEAYCPEKYRDFLLALSAMNKL